MMETKSAIEVVCPTRICDLGGWTDTWFAKRGAVLNVGVLPGVRVCVSDEEDTKTVPKGAIEIRLKNFETVYRFDATVRHNALIDAVVGYLAPYAWETFSIAIESEIPPGASMGTSAAVMVGLIRGLRQISLRDDVETSDARLAHWIEAELLGQQTGVQDQVIASLGGIQLIEISAYPNYESSAVAASPKIKQALVKQLRTVYLGMPHFSSAIHEKVIARMAHDEAFNQRFLEDLRTCAYAGRDCLVAGDLAGFGAMMTRNTDVQRAMHEDLVSPLAERLIAKLGGLCEGWKVNGAGGDGGSVSFLVKEGKMDAFLQRFETLAEEEPLLQLFAHQLAN